MQKEAWRVEIYRLAYYKALNTIGSQGKVHWVKVSVSPSLSSPTHTLLEPGEVIKQFKVYKTALPKESGSLHPYWMVHNNLQPQL